MVYELYYWPEIQGRGEFVRRGGTSAMLKLLDDERVKTPSFAPPFLKAGKLLIGQTANILLFLGPRHQLAPAGEAGRLWTHQLQLTMADFVVEIHDAHHPISSSLYYEDQRKEARRRTQDFLKSRAPKYLGYFEGVLEKSPGRYLVGRTATYADFSLFQIVAGLRYAFPRAMARLEKRHPRVVAVHDRVGERPRIAAYLDSERRIAFNQMGIFRHYKELDP